MKRILFFLLLLVNLQLTMVNGSLRIGFEEIAAQRLMEEQLPKVITSADGIKYVCQCSQTFDNISDYTYHIENLCTYIVQCEDCWAYLWQCRLRNHQFYLCPKRRVTCPTCKVICKAEDIDNGLHKCQLPSRCMWCNKILDPGVDCGCPGAIINGQRKDFVNLYDGPLLDPNNYVDDFGGGGSLIQINDYKYINKKPHMPFHKLKKSTGIKWLGNKRATTASENLKKMGNMHPQLDGTHDCVPRAFAFMEELWYGVDFETALKKNKAYARKMGIDTDVEGFDFNHMALLEAQAVFKNNPIVICYLNDIETIRECIDNGIPVAVAGHCYPLHMVVIIGYDLDNSGGNKFYVAGGNSECDVSIIGVMHRNNNYKSVYGIK